MPRIADSDVKELHHPGKGRLRRAMTAATLRRVETTISFDSGPQHIDDPDDPNDPYNQGMLQYFKVFTSALRSITPYSDPDMRVPLRVLFPVSFVCLFYIVCRCFFYVLDFYTLRQQPVGVYWSAGFNVMPQ